MIIYKVINKENNKVYIGQTIWSLDRRMNKHISDSKNMKTIFHRALQKYGIENFEWKVIEKCETRELLNENEKYYIYLYNSFGDGGYNMTDGGNCKKRLPFSKEHKDRISKSCMGRRNSDDSIKKQSDKIRGLKQSDETIKKRSLSLKGHIVSEETKNKIRDKQIGIKRPGFKNKTSFQKGNVPWNKGLKNKLITNE